MVVVSFSNIYYQVRVPTKVRKGKKENSIKLCTQGKKSNTPSHCDEGPYRLTILILYLLIVNKGFFGGSKIGA